MAEKKLNIQDKVLSYEQFLNETLREDLRNVLEDRDKIYSEITEFLQLKTTIERIKESKLGTTGLKTKVDLGCNFYVQATVPDTSRIFVNVGYGLFLEYTLDEAVKFAEKKIRRLTETTDQLTRDSVKIKAHIKLVIQGLKELQGIDDKIEKPRRDI